MQKVKLDLDTIQVESFVANTGGGARGTVRGHLCACCCCNPCICTCCDTCQATCAASCQTCPDSCWGTCVDPTCAGRSCDICVTDYCVTYDVQLAGDAVQRAICY
ncbi:MAG TPA: hypothetical protein VFJ16_19280 [Longimicrobium sp.]|nr:hypothetical protein [Longimicrobium sp.]